MPDIELASYQGQQEITEAINKLTLSSVPQKAVWFDNVASMVAYDLPVGVTAATRGYHTVNDGGSAFYYIREVAVGDVDDGGSIIFLDNGNVAELITDGVVNVRQFGAKGDGTTDDTTAIQNAISYGKRIEFLYGTYKMTSTLVVPAKKTVVGITDELKQETNTTALVFSTDITCLSFSGRNSTFENIDIIHPNTNTNPPIDMSGAKYIKVKNVHLYHDGNCPANGIYVDNSDWSGYVEIENVSAIGYAICLNIQRGTFWFFKDCKFNSATTQNLYLNGEIFNFLHCDISGNNLAVEYAGEFSVNFYGCYFEPRYYGSGSTKLAKYSGSYKGATINFYGGKVFLSHQGTSYGSSYGLVNYDNCYFHPSMLPNYANGYHSSVNKLQNGDFHAGFLGWTSTPTPSVITSGLPNGYGSGAFFTYADNNTQGEIKKQIGKLHKGTWTIGMWIKFVNHNTSAIDKDIFISDGTAGSSPIVMRYRMTSPITEDWMYLTSTFEITDDNVAGTWWLRFFIKHVQYVYITGVGLYEGVYYENSNGNSCSEENVLTDKLVIKGADDKYYQISVNGGTISATEVTV